MQSTSRFDISIDTSSHIPPSSNTIVGNLLDDCFRMNKRNEMYASGGVDDSGRREEEEDDPLEDEDDPLEDEVEISRFHDDIHISNESEFCDLCLSSFDNPLDHSGRGSTSSFGKKSGPGSGLLISLVLTKVYKEKEYAHSFLDRTSGPYFSEPDFGLFQAQEIPRFTNGDFSKGCNVSIIPLNLIVRHVVSTIRITSVPVYHFKGGVQIDTGKKRKMITVKEVIREKEPCLPYSEKASKPRRKRRKTTAGGGSEELLLGDKQRRSERNEGPQKTKGTETNDMMTTMHSEKVVFFEYDRSTFCSQRVLRQKMFPVMVTHGDVIFSVSLASLILLIAEELCMYEHVYSSPIPISRSLPDNLDPYTFYSFPILEASKTMIRMLNEERRRSSNPGRSSMSSSVRLTESEEEVAMRAKSMVDLNGFEQSSTSSFSGKKTPLRNIQFPSQFINPSEEFYGPIVKHLREVLCDNDPIAYTLVETWLTEILFDPCMKYPICPIFSGPQGVGKNILFDFFVKYVFGFDTATMLMNLKQCSDRFNSVLKNKLLLVINEEDLNKSDQALQVMKTLCSEIFQCIEEKYVSLKENVPIFTRMCILTNNPDPFRDLSAGERRFVIVKTRKALPDTSYFEKLSSLVGNSKNAPITALHFIGYLAELRRHRGPLSMSCLSSTKGLGEPIPEDSLLSGDECNTCVIPHRLMHDINRRGYDPSIMRRPVMTQFMIEKIIENMNPLHYFLYIFIVRGLALEMFLPDEIWSDPDLIRSIPVFRSLSDLRYVEHDYFHSCYKIYLDHGHTRHRQGMSVRKLSNGFNRQSFRSSGMDYNVGRSFGSTMGTRSIFGGGSSELSPMRSLWSPSRLSCVGDSPSPSFMENGSYSVLIDELSTDLGLSSSSSPSSPIPQSPLLSSESNGTPDSPDVIFADVCKEKDDTGEKKRGRPKKETVFKGPQPQKRTRSDVNTSRNTTNGVTKTVLTSTNLWEIKRINDVNRELESFIGDNNTPTDREDSNSVVHSRMVTGTSNLYRRDPTTNVSEKLLNLSGVRKSFEQKHRECYDYLNDMFDGMIGEVSNDANESSQTKDDELVIIE